jgi:AcrR family transcriptional regulator
LRRKVREFVDEEVIPREKVLGGDDEAARAAIALWVGHYRQRLAEMSGVFQASMVQDGFRTLWAAIRADAIRMIASRIRRAQQQGFCPGADALLMGSALSSMLEHFCFVWFYHGGDDIDVEFDEERAIEMLTDVWYHAIYWRDEPSE